MKFQVIYFSKTGNTKKVAKAIASELDVKAENVKKANLNGDCIVFLGSGCYDSKPAKIMTKFIENNNFKSRDVALFGTSGSGEGIECREMENILNKKGACIKGKFCCKGKAPFYNKGRPNDEDIEHAKEFAQNLNKKKM